MISRLLTMPLILAAFMCLAPLALADQSSTEAPEKSVVDGCGAYQYQGIIGLPIDVINVDALPDPSRVYYVDGDVGMTRDLDWTRLTIIVGTDGRISDVHCG